MNNRRIAAELNERENASDDHLALFDSVNKMDNDDWRRKVIMKLCTAYEKHLGLAAQCSRMLQDIEQEKDPYIVRNKLGHWACGDAGELSSTLELDDKPTMF